jgi:hypothetical protein
MGVLAVTSELGKSAAFDEIIHLPVGYAALAQGDLRMNPAHPPLARMISAVPLLFMDVRTDPDDLAWKRCRPWEWGKRFLYRWNDGDRLLFWGRLMITGLAGLLVVAVYAWARRLFGTAAGLCAAVFAALSPDVIAHGRIVTNDVAITLFFFLTVVAFEKLTERFTLRRLAATGVLLGAAFATKFSSLGLLPVLGALSLFTIARKEPLVVDVRGERRLDRRASRALVLAGAFVVMAVLSVATIWAAHGFRSELARDPKARAFFRWETVEPRSAPVRVLADAVRGTVLPKAWVWAYLFVARFTESRPAFLMGQRSSTGWWYFFPATIALKTPIPLLLLGAGALVLHARRGGRSVVFVWLPLLFFLGLVMTRTINIGHRHVMPIYPFLFIAAGSAAGALWETTGRARRWARGAVVALLGWYAANALLVYPDYLGFFNEAVGGPRNGYRLLVDSNLDWGQDLPGLKKYMESHGIPRLKLAYFGTADPAYYGMNVDRLPGYQPPPPSVLVRSVRPGDVLAISATHLQGLYIEPGMDTLMEKLLAREPEAQVGHSILIYRADFSWDQPPPPPTTEPATTP